jgi:microcystin degradation protein MlrC
MAVAKVPVITSAIHGSTDGDDPFARVMRFGKGHEKEKGVLSTSVFLVHPNLDLPEMGSGGLVITDGDAEKAEGLAREIASRYWDLRRELEPEVHAPRAAIERGMGIDGGPVLLVEAADCCGGGAAGDSVAALGALLEVGVDQPSLVQVVDAEAAALCHRAGAGAELELELGHRHDPRWGKPLRVRGQVLKVSDGKFAYQGGIFAGTEGNMGPAAVLAFGAVRALVATHATYDWLDEQYRSMGLDPAAAKFVVAKNPMNYRMAYGEIAKAVFVLDTPGPTPATVRHLPYRNLQRPFFPVDPDMAEFGPVIYRPRQFAQRKAEGRGGVGPAG